MSGEVQFFLKDPKSCQQIQISLFGGAHVEWVRQYQEGNVTRTEKYVANETYVDEAKILWQSSDSPDGKIGPGMISLPFQFTLPPNCQSTHPNIQSLADIARIAYTLKAKIITTGFLTNESKVEMPLKVKKITDINLPDLILPTQRSEHTPVGCLCNAGELQFTANLPRTGLCAGEKFPLTVDVENSSSRRIHMRIRIKRHWTYEASGQMFEQSRFLKVYNSPRIEPNSQYTWNVTEMMVPYVVPTMEGSQIIKTEDSLEVAAVIPWDLNASVEFPITIGNVPFREDLAPQLP